MTDPSVFYNRGDAWHVPFGSTSGGTDPSSAPLEAYYTMMRLPGDTGIQFMLMVPFTPASKPNMIAWMAARGDAPDYGRVDVIRFPSKHRGLRSPADQFVYQSRPHHFEPVDACGTRGVAMWCWVTCWCYRWGRSVLSVQPLFLQATNNSLPALKRVIASAGGQVGMGDDLNGALAAMFRAQAQQPTPNGSDSGTPVAGGTAPPGTPVLLTPGVPGTALACTGTPQSLSNTALDHYQRAQAALKLGDWTTYGQGTGAGGSGVALPATGDTIGQTAARLRAFLQAYEQPLAIWLALRVGLTLLAVLAGLSLPSRSPGGTAPYHLPPAPALWGSLGGGLGALGRSLVSANRQRRVSCRRRHHRVPAALSMGSRSARQPVGWALSGGGGAAVCAHLRWGGAAALSAGA